MQVEGREVSRRTHDPGQYSQEGHLDPELIAELDAADARPKETAKIEKVLARRKLKEETTARFEREKASFQ